MRPRTLARKNLQPLLQLYRDYGQCIFENGMSYDQRATLRGELVVDSVLSGNILVCALLYDIGNLLQLANNQVVTYGIDLKRDKQAAHYLTKIFTQNTCKPIRLKSIAYAYRSQKNDIAQLCLSSGTLALATKKIFEESPWFFSSMTLLRINKRIDFKAKSKGCLEDFEEVLLTHTHILINKEKQYA
jgi:hypothetical protein